MITALLIFQPMDSKTLHVLSQNSEKMTSDLVEMVTDTQSQYTIVNIAETAITNARNDSVLDSFKAAIKEHKDYSGILYSLSFNSVIYTIVGEVKGDVAYLHTIKNKIVTDAKHFNLKDSEKSSTGFYLNIIYSDLVNMIDEELKETENKLKDLIEANLALCVMKIKFRNLYGNEFKLGTSNSQKLVK